jgi:enamine deaminase RidA (YjgF/YER057c/UK114 family)
MYFLNGDRIYIKPESGCVSWDAQFQSCLQQLRQINSGKKIFKLNFFIDAVSSEAYKTIQQRIREEVTRIFSESIVLGFVAQPPLTCKIIVEAFFYDFNLWKPEFIRHENGAATIFSRENTEIMVGNIQSNTDGTCRENAETAFGTLSEIFQSRNFPVNSIVRQWNYLEDILGFDGGQQRYQEFNNVRSEFYGNAFRHSGFPAATGIGMNRGGVIIEFVAIKSDAVKTVPVDNPGQIAAHHYSNNVLVGDGCIQKTTPKFERARYFELFGKKQIFISGTAAIVGEKTVGADDPEEQTKVTIQNILRLYSTEVLAKISSEPMDAKYGHARVYVKRRKDFPIIKKTFKTHFGNLPVVYIIADICRENLLVEIEGKVVLE